MLAHLPRAVRIIVALFVVTQLMTLAWDLPCIYGWENDGVAPRDVFGGLAAAFTPGASHRYPLFHYLLVALVALPVIATAACVGWMRDDVVTTMLSVPALTGIELMAKLLSVAMGTASVLVLARITQRLFGASAAVWACLLCVTNLTFSYYARSVNLDGPYLLWGLLALSSLLSVMERGERQDYRRLLFFAALSIATKDQAYALYALSLPWLLVLWPALLGRFDELIGHLRGLVRQAWVFALTYGLASGALFNPTGFLARVALLSGENSQSYRIYEASATGVARNVSDVASSLPEFFWPWPLLVWCGLGVLLLPWVGWAEGRLGRFDARVAPLLFALSSFVTFTLVAARCEHRFVLPLAALLCPYGGLLAGALASGASRHGRVARWGFGALLLLGARGSLALHLTQHQDARFRVEERLATLPSGSRVETYGLGVYLPRFDLSDESPYRVTRVGPDTRPRPRIPALREVYAPYGEYAGRAADMLVIPEGFENRFRRVQTVGQVQSSVGAQMQLDQDAVSFFERAVNDRLPGYRLTLTAAAALPAWAQWLGMEPVQIHGSTGGRLWLLERALTPAGSTTATTH